MAKQQLLAMGFPEDLAGQALIAACDDVAKATEWILSNPTGQRASQDSSDSNPDQPSTSPFQPKINRFFQSQSKPSTHHEEEEIEEPQLHRSTKRPKLAVQTAATTTKTPHEPLSERMRPRTLEEVIGQDHLLGPTSVLKSAIGCGRIPSILLWGPPGTGKTSIARAILNSCFSAVSGMYRFVSLSAVTSGVKDVRDAVDEAKKLKKLCQKRTILFMDEVHRFNKAQQDSFLPVIEDGSVVFIGATTENPSFHLITPLLSRCRVLTLNALKPEHLSLLLRRAVADSDKGLACSSGSWKGLRIEVSDEAIEFLSMHCDGDARVALNALEISATIARSRLSFASHIDCDGALEISAANATARSRSSLAPNIDCGGDARVALMNPLEILASNANVRSKSSPNIECVGALEISAANTIARSRSSFTPNIECDGALEILDVNATARSRLSFTPNIECDGDARVGLNITLSDVKEALQCKHLAYDRAGDEHYNLISALHKSMRGSDADASIYWLARMLEGGENPLYIARRLVRFASEDVGLADPNALLQAVACYQACHFLGMPECNVNLVQCVAYLATAPKSIAVYRAMNEALKVVRESVGQNEGVPLHLRNAPTKLMKDLGYGKDYIYTPDNPNSSQTFLPPSLQGYKFLNWP